MGNQSSVGAATDGEFVDAVDYDAVRADILKMMDSPEHDDGSFAPLLIRLAWHSSGTYCKADGTGGSNGATMRYPLEAGDPENAGLEVARKFLQPVKDQSLWARLGEGQGSCYRVTMMGAALDEAQRSSDRIGTVQRQVAWLLLKDEMRKSRRVTIGHAFRI